jgi:hypothetical protein
MKHDIYGLDIVVADPCRCGSPLIRVCTQTLDENYQHETDDDEIAWD